MRVDDHPQMRGKPEAAFLIDNLPDTRQRRHSQQYGHQDVRHNECLFMLSLARRQPRLVVIGAKPPNPNRDNAQRGRQLKPDQHEGERLMAHPRRSMATVSRRGSGDWSSREGTIPRL
jgi:hypothetical protein